MTNANTEATLDYVKSRWDIVDCVNRYTRGMDRLDRESALSAFHDDAVLDYGVFVGSPTEFFDYFSDLHRHHHHSTNHMICNHVCELDGDTAHTETYFAVANNNVGDPPFSLAGGRYVDRFERRDGRWAIAARLCMGEWDATPGNELAETLIAKFKEVFSISRDRNDASYRRPLNVDPARIGTNISV
jgi:hypothetical protein